MLLEKAIIISEDNKIIEFIKNHLYLQKLDCQSSNSALKGIELLKQQTFDLIICDLDLSEIPGIDLLQLAKNLQPHALCIALAFEQDSQKALSAIRQGAFQYLLKPLTVGALEAILQKTFEQAHLLHENEFLRKEMSYPQKSQKSPLIAESPAMKNLLEDVAKIAKSNASVFIIGESGTGKEVVANAIHELSFRSQKPFIRVNCAAIPDALLESEFFGHEKGAFTGAIQKRLGRFELANQGTLLLDEISEVPLEIQPKLLRVVQEQEFERVGGTKPIKVDVRLISTSNRNMQESVENKRFREDLYFRLHVVPLHIPPLRQRKEDILPLAYHFLFKFCKDNLKELKHLSSGAEERLLDYYWPGNVRELANIIERTVVMHSGETIKTEELKLEISCPVPSYKTPSKTLADLEKAHILATLQTFRHDKTQTADSLGISLKALRSKLKTHQID